MKNKLFISLLPIKTNRLIINKTTTKDVSFMLKTDKQEDTQKFVGGIKNYTYEERISFLKSKEEKFNNNIASSLTVYLDNTPIGLIGLKIDEVNNIGELSYIFDSDYWHQGYCYEASKSLIDIGFNILKLDKIIANSIKDNIASQKLLEKLSFKYLNEENKNNEIFKNYELKNHND